MCEVCEFEQLNDIYVLNVFLREVIIDVDGLKDFLVIKNDDGLFFIYLFIFGVCNEIVMVLLRYNIMKFVCLEIEEFYEQYFYFLLVFCMFIEKLEIMEYIL